ncbi:MAG TPA: alpha/beta fold hydrolase, partial [Candidatus Baltobacteraceae bacterium]|nr:alpha/beta fold hydrolase [Candidatus Baltobacteraceae bacterium]
MKRFIGAIALAASALAWSAPARASLPPPLPKSQQSFNSGSIHVDVYGTPGKPALIFIPGLTCGPWEWAGEITQFAPNYTIYALTLPGFDDQPAVSGAPFDTVSADFWTLLQTRNIQKPILIGHSLGGTLGFMLAEQHSDRLRALVAVDGMPVFPGMDRVTPAQRAGIAARTASALASMSTPAQFEAAEKNYALVYMITSKDDIAAVAPLTARSDPKATARWMQDDMMLDTRPQLSAITIPVLEIAPFDPKLDPFGPGKISSAQQKQAYYESLLKGDATARVQVVQPSRHFIMYDQPQALDALLAQFLGQTANRA